MRHSRQIILTCVLMWSVTATLAQNLQTSGSVVAAKGATAKLWCNDTEGIINFFIWRDAADGALIFNGESKSPEDKYINFQLEPTTEDSVSIIEITGTEIEEEGEYYCEGEYGVQSTRGSPISVTVEVKGHGPQLAFEKQICNEYIPCRATCGITGEKPSVSIKWAIGSDVLDCNDTITEQNANDAKLWDAQSTCTFTPPRKEDSDLLYCLIEGHHVESFNRNTSVNLTSARCVMNVAFEEFTTVCCELEERCKESNTTYIIYQNETPIKAQSQDDCSSLIQTLDEDDVYTCIASNDIGSLRATASPEVPLNVFFNEGGKSPTVCCQFGGSSPTDYVCTINRNGKEINSTENCAKWDNSNKNDTYECIAAIGNITYSARATPQRYTGKLSQNSPITVCCLLDSGEKIPSTNYIFYKNGKNVTSSSTSSCLVLDTDVVRHSTCFLCEAHNKLGVFRGSACPIATFITPKNIGTYVLVELVLVFLTIIIIARHENLGLWACPLLVTIFLSLLTIMILALTDITVMEQIDIYTICLFAFPAVFVIAWASSVHRKKLFAGPVIALACCNRKEHNNRNEVDAERSTGNKNSKEEEHALQPDVKNSKEEEHALQPDVKSP